MICEHVGAAVAGEVAGLDTPPGGWDDGRPVFKHKARSRVVTHPHGAVARMVGDEVIERVAVERSRAKRPTRKRIDGRPIRERDIRTTIMAYPHRSIARMVRGDVGQTVSIEVGGSEAPSGCGLDIPAEFPFNHVRTSRLCGEYRDERKRCETK